LEANKNICINRFCLLCKGLPLGRLDESIAILNFSNYTQLLFEKQGNPGHILERKKRSSCFKSLITSSSLLWRIYVSWLYISQGDMLISTRHIGQSLFLRLTNQSEKQDWQNLCWTISNARGVSTVQGSMNSTNRQKQISQTSIRSGSLLRANCLLSLRETGCLTFISISFNAKNKQLR